MAVVTYLVYHPLMLSCSTRSLPPVASLLGQRRPHQQSHGYPPPPLSALIKQVRSGTSTNSFMMVDSPGMIDSPMSRSIYDRSLPDDSTDPRRGSDTSRGYDFEGVVRWFAERADVILLFFDPDKPGTTGETLSILTNSLPGMDHKLYIVLNKVRAPPPPLPRASALRRAAGMLPFSDGPLSFSVFER